MKSRTKDSLSLVLKIIVLAFTLWYLVRNDYLTRESLNLFKLENYKSIIISVLAYIITQMMASLRLSLLLKKINYKISYFHALKLVIIGNFFNFVLPGSVGGDFIKCIYLYDNEQENKGRSAGIVLLDRIIGLMSIFILGFISIVYLILQKSISFEQYGISLYVSLASIVAIIVVFLSLFIFALNKKARSKLRVFLSNKLGQSFYYFALEGIGKQVKNFRIVFLCLGLSILIQLVSLIGLISLTQIFSGVYKLPEYDILMAVSSIVMILGIIPITPGNIGWTEFVGAFGWSVVGSNIGATIFLYWRIVTIFCSLPGGVLYFFNRGFKLTKSHGKYLNTQEN